MNTFNKVNMQTNLTFFLLDTKTTNKFSIGVLNVDITNNIILYPVI